MSERRLKDKVTLRISLLCPVIQKLFISVEFMLFCDFLKNDLEI
jgi:hypothetical protein